MPVPGFRITRATAENMDEAPATRGELKPVELKRGQLIVIRGLDTQFYIPPTGVDIVPDTSVDDSGAAISGAAALKLLAQAPPPPAEPEKRVAEIMMRGEADAYASDDMGEEGAQKSPAWRIIVASSACSLAINSAMASRRSCVSDSNPIFMRSCSTPE